MNTEEPTRKPIRLQGYNYAGNGAYFVTVCTHERQNILWNAGATSGRSQQILLSRTGQIVDNEIEGIRYLCRRNDR